MKNRACRLYMAISNDSGVVKKYFLRPLSAEALGPEFVAGYTVSNASENPSPVYAVHLSAGGIVSCDCPFFKEHGKCKHADALTAAKVLPVHFVELLWQHHVVDSRDREEMQQRIRELETALSVVEQRAEQLQLSLAAVGPMPIRRRTRKAKAA